MTARRATIVFIVAILAGIAALFLLWRAPVRELPKAAPSAGAGAPKTSPAPQAPKSESKSEGVEMAGSPIADKLNAPEGTIAADLKILQDLFGAFQTNFPRQGNPVGENAEITAALLGENPARFRFIARTHRAVNAKGELCDRWGTPFRFHQLSGTQMEIRSAGPDRKFATPDDAELSP
jgi:hypothetical protein